MPGIVAVLLVVIGISVDAIASAAQNTDHYRFGVFPYLSPVRMDEIYAPIAQELARHTEHDVRFHTSSTLDRFLEKLKSSHYDIALIGPFWYPVAVDRNMYIPVAKVQEPLVSLIIVLQDSQVSEIEDLRGRVIGTPPAFVPITHMGRRALVENGIRPDQDVTLRAFKSNDSCFQQMMIGEVDACVAPPFAPAVFENRMNVKTRTVLKSSAIPNLSVVVHPRVPEHDREAIRQAFVSWGSTEKGRKFLSIMRTGGFVPVDDQEFNVVREFLQQADDTCCPGIGKDSMLQ